MSSALEPHVGADELATYLQLHGWRPTQGGRLAQLWAHPHHEDSSILLPLIEGASDYGKRVRLLINDLAAQEDRDPREIQTDISLVFFDVTNLRAAHPELIDDSIPLQAGYQLFQSARKLMIAAAAATLRRQGHFGRSLPLQARDHARHVRLGHTRRGSYILPVISRARPSSPIPNEQEHLDMDVEESLFDRRVLGTLSGALQVLEDMTVRTERLPSKSEVADAVGVGVSRELCQAIGAVMATDAVSELDITFNWSPTVPPPRGATREVVFPKESSDTVEYVAEQLKTFRREREHLLFGLITDLHHSADEEALGGRVGMETVVDRRRRSVWFNLDEESYQLAVRCHGDRTRVMVRGVLRAPAGQQATMDVSEFGPDSSLSDAAAVIGGMDLG
ncbi:hypothetical protein ACIBG8_29035 [Nonomuraea sp. NPDC050556]|uniref:hypothetical protein n=1 Tax=Nonomuraea sp. NPDC050556 TaxID=3364369 RepID=UPI0037B85B85